MDASEDLDAWDLEAFFGPATGGWWTSRLSRAPWIRRTDITLPLRVVAEMIAPAERPNSQSEASQRFGLQLHATERDAETLVQAVQPHIVVTTAPHDVLAVAGRMTAEDRPRLVVWLDEVGVY